MAKPPHSIEEQIELLVARGLPIPLAPHSTDEEGEAEYSKTVRFLVDNNYYRLSGYWRYFQVAPGRGDNRFSAGATFSHIKSTYTFDNELRCLLMEGLSILEVTFRSRLAYYMAMAMPIDGYLDPTSYFDNKGRGKARIDSLIKDIRVEVGRSREKFVAHHDARGEGVPIWAAVEVFSFGTLSKMYGLLGHQGVRSQVSKSLGLPSPQFTATAIRSFVVLRNLCAHHSRLWHRVPEVPPPVLNKFKRAEPDLYRSASPWAWFVMLSDLVDEMRQDTAFSSRLWVHINSRPELLDGYKFPRHT